MGDEDLIYGVLFVVLLLVLASLIFREFRCWYWKINTTVALLTDIRDLLEERSEARRQNEAAVDAPAVDEPVVAYCSHCGVPLTRTQRLTHDKESYCLQHLPTS